VPATVTAVRIFADCDANFRGQAAAYRLAHRLATIRRGLEVSVYVPRETGKDFLDVYYARRRVAA
jgi:putative DNA primase/helicase